MAKLLFLLHAGHFSAGPITPINYIALDLVYCQPVLLYSGSLPVPCTRYVHSAKHGDDSNSRGGSYPNALAGADFNRNPDYDQLLTTILSP